MLRYLASLALLLSSSVNAGRINNLPGLAVMPSFDMYSGTFIMNSASRAQTEYSDSLAVLC